MAGPPPNWHVVADAETLARQVDERIASLCVVAVDDRGVFHWVLAGGDTPGRCYEYLRKMPLAWEHVHIWFGDERCLPVGEGGRNDLMAQKVLLAHVPVPSGNVHRISAELEPEAGAAAYAEALKCAPVLDVALLGVGEDGHTASLFPGSPALTDERLAVPVFDAPKPPPERVSMGYATLNGAVERIVMVSGSSKRDALQRIRNGEDLPAGRLATSEWYVDRAAAG